MLGAEGGDGNPVRVANKADSALDPAKPLSAGWLLSVQSGCRGPCGSTQKLGSLLKVKLRLSQADQRSAGLSWSQAAAQKLSRPRCERDPWGIPSERPELVVSAAFTCHQGHCTLALLEA